jgi:predicted short-subunit dehydrogenase-like oxidoreductase (DUF2520 family)
MADLSIIGAGRLGTALGRALAGRGHKIKALSCRHKASALESWRIIGQGKAMTDNAAAAQRGEVIFLCLPDEEIARVAKALSRAKIDWGTKVVYHTSGLLPAKVLAPLAEKGARTASFHPIQSFPSKKTGPGHFRGIYFGLEGDREALVFAGKLIARLGGRALIIPSEAKPLYHAAFSLTSNFFVVLLDASVRLLQKAGIPEKKSRSILFPLVEGTLHNVKEIDMAAALTGPVVRGDAASVKTHLDALRAFPRLAQAYKDLGFLALELAKKKGLSQEKVKTLRNLLEGK